MLRRPAHASRLCAYLVRQPPVSRLSPYTTLFRSHSACSSSPIFPALMSSPAKWSPTRCPPFSTSRSEEHTSELQSPCNIVCRPLLDKKIPPALRGLLTAAPCSSYLWRGAWVDFAP